MELARLDGDEPAVGDPFRRRPRLRQLPGGQVLLEAMCDALPNAQAHLEEFDARAAARGLFVD
ncbi:hypothetical protein GCM10017771_36890 [Streptomyces capitiformicae]|uniref:Uncharacterized protein n=1 Tax=Streptomyces capitiformicae TaxID=2014920 RepID=A0A919GRQ0_9ACTN|nr:hypothetical protein GCM10017771_36890 [Streptomyces capitiformicae]